MCVQKYLQKYPYVRTVVHVTIWGMVDLNVNVLQTTKEDFVKVSCPVLLFILFFSLLFFHFFPLSLQGFVK